MKLIYSGPFGAVNLADGTQMPRGATVEVNDALAAELLKRPDEFAAASAPVTDDGGDA